MKTSEHIRQYANPQAQQSDFSDSASLDEYFDFLADGQDDAGKWPFCFDGDEVQPVYQKARVHPDRFGDGQSLELEVRLKLPQNELLVAENLAYGDERLQMDLASFYCLSGHGKSGFFVQELLEKQRSFMADYQKRRRAQGESTEALFSVHASSGIVDHCETNGGLTWALHGFDFADKKELESARERFKDFAARNGVSFKNNDLKLFTKPCHFAAFQCGVKNNGLNLGRAFLLKYSWFGKMVIDPNKPVGEEVRYARSYYNPDVEDRHTAALKELNKPYLRMMNAYYKKYAQKPKKDRRLLAFLPKKFSIFR